MQERKNGCGKYGREITLVKMQDWEMREVNLHVHLQYKHRVASDILLN